MRSSPTIRRSEEHTSELQSRLHLVCRLLLEKKKKEKPYIQTRRSRIPNAYASTADGQTNPRDRFRCTTRRCAVRYVLPHCGARLAVSSLQSAVLSVTLIYHITKQMSIYEST